MRAYIQNPLSDSHHYPVSYSYSSQNRVLTWATVIEGDTAEKALAAFKRDNPLLVAAKIITAEEGKEIVRKGEGYL